MASLETLVIEVDGDVSGATSSLSSLESTASRSAASTESSLGRVSEGFDTTDTRAMGFRDTLTGLMDGFQGATDSSLPLSERLLLLGTGVGDLASGMVNFLIPTLGKTVVAMGAWIASMARASVALARNLAATIATRVALIAGAIAMGVVTAAQWLWNIAMSMNPIALIIIAIVAFLVILGLLAKNWDKITKFIKDVWNRVWDWVAAKLSLAGRLIVIGAQAIWAGITSAWNRGVSFIQGAVSRIGSFFSGMWAGIGNGLRSALNGAIGLINNAIYGINTLIRGANAVPGVSIPSIPSIPFLADGGIVTGPTLAMIGEGANDEAVIPLPKGMRDGMLGGGGGSSEVTIRLEGDEDLVRLFRRGIADRGGNVQAVLGS